MDIEFKFARFSSKKTKRIIDEVFDCDQTLPCRKRQETRFALFQSFASFYVRRSTDCRAEMTDMSVSAQRVLSN